MYVFKGVNGSPEVVMSIHANKIKRYRRLRSRSPELEKYRQVNYLLYVLLLRAQFMYCIMLVMRFTVIYNYLVITIIIDFMIVIDIRPERHLQLDSGVANCNQQ